MAEPVLAAEAVMRDLVDALIQERLGGFADGVPEGGGWYRVGEVRLRLRDGGALQPHRFAGGPVLHGNRELNPAALLELVAAGEPYAGQVAADLRCAVEHADVVARGTAARVPHGMLSGERIAALRNRPFHPTARAATGWSAAELAEYGTTRTTPLGLDWVAVRADRLRYGSGPGSHDLASLLLRETDRGRAEAALDPGFRLLPVHPWQFDHVLPREFPDELAAGDIRPVTRDLGAFRPTASLRTLTTPDPARHVKLPLGIATLGAARLLPPRYLDNGERAEHTLRAIVHSDPDLAALVAVCDERTWCGWAGDEFADRPGHLAAQVRTYPADALDAVPMAAFAVPGTDPGGDPVAFFRRLADGFCTLALRFLRQGVLPELHGQNVAVTLRDGVPVRFVLRDHDTVRVHPQWMRKAGVEPPGYRVRPGAPQSLCLDEPGRLVGYLQTLGFQVNLYGIADALSRHHRITEGTLWHQLRTALTNCLDRIPLPEEVRESLLHAPTWPSRQVLGPLLRQGRSAGVSMPASTGEVPNPLLP